MDNEQESIALEHPVESVSPAVIAWQELCQSQGQPAHMPISARRIKPKRLHRFHKSEIYRMNRVGSGEFTMIAKKCLKSTAPVERLMYEEILPILPVSSLAYHGFHEDSDENWCWVFMGDAGDRKPEETDRVLIARWLAHFHRSAARLAKSANLPDRGPAHCFNDLQESISDVGSLLRLPKLADDDLNALRTIRPTLKVLETNWNRVCRPCQSVPWTVVHGDFVNKNVRIQDGLDGPRIVVLDWETSGWGPPAADLSRWPHHSAAFGAETADGEIVVEQAIDAYLEVWRQSPFDITREMFDKLAAVGALFRMVASLRWACEQLRFGGSKGSVLVQMYARCLPQAIDAALK